MKIAVLSDIHANLPALKAVYQQILAEQVEAVYCLGDLVGYGAFPNEVVQFIREHRIPTVMGNFDEAAGFDLMESGCRSGSIEEHVRIEETFLWTKSVLTESNRLFLQALPMQIRFKIANRRVLFVHGSPRRINEYLTADLPAATFEQISRLAGCDILCVGHSHQQFHRRAAMTSILNPGSVGVPSGEPVACYAVLELGWKLQADFRSVEYDVQLASGALEGQCLPVPVGMEDISIQSGLSALPAAGSC